MRDKDGVRCSINPRRHRKEEYLRPSAEIVTEYLDTIKAQAKALACNIEEVKDLYDDRNMIDAAKDIAGNMCRTLYDAESMLSKYKSQYDLKVTPFPEVKGLTNDIYAYLTKISKGDVGPIRQAYRIFKNIPFLTTGIPSIGLIKDSFKEMKREGLLEKTKSKIRQLEDILEAHKEKPRRLSEVLYVSCLVFGSLLLLLFSSFMSISGFAVKHSSDTKVFNYSLVTLVIFLVFIGLMRFRRIFSLVKH